MMICLSMVITIHSMYIYIISLGETDMEIDVKLKPFCRNCQDVKDLSVQLA